MARYDVTGIGINLREIADDSGAVKLKVLGIILDGPAHAAGVRQVFFNLRFSWFLGVNDYYSELLFIIWQVLFYYLTLFRIKSFFSTSFIGNEVTVYDVNIASIWQLEKSIE